MVTRIKELEKQQINRDMVSVLDFRVIEVLQHFPFSLFSVALLISNPFSYFLLTG